MVYIIGLLVKLVGGRLCSWYTYIIGLLGGLIVMYLVVKVMTVIFLLALSSPSSFLLLSFSVSLSVTIFLFFLFSYPFHHFSLFYG